MKWRCFDDRMVLHIVVGYSHARVWHSAAPAPVCFACCRHASSGGVFMFVRPVPCKVLQSISVIARMQCTDLGRFMRRVTIVLRDPFLSLIIHHKPIRLCIFIQYQYAWTKMVDTKGYFKAQMGLFETRVLQILVVYDHIPDILTVGYPFSRRSQV